MGKGKGRAEKLVTTAGTAPHEAEVHEADESATAQKSIATAAKGAAARSKQATGATKAASSKSTGRGATASSWDADEDTPNEAVATTDVSSDAASDQQDQNEAVNTAGAKGRDATNRRGRAPASTASAGRDAGSSDETTDNEKNSDSDESSGGRNAERGGRFARSAQQNVRNAAVEARKSRSSRADDEGEERQDDSRRSSRDSAREQERSERTGRGAKSNQRSSQPEDDRSQRASGEQAEGTIRYAVVGLGHIAQAARLPAFRHAKKNSELAALVSGDPHKLDELGERYGVEARFDYSGLRRCLRDEGIDAVYIATPNTEHLPIILEAARAGVHVLCEKPLCVTERDCFEAIRACDEAGVKLMTAYRLHFEAANLRALEIVRNGEIGDPRVFTSVFSYQVKPDNIRTDASVGGGPLHDIGIYCINAARTLFGNEPIEVHAWESRSGDERFDETEETVTAMLRFPGDRIAHFTVSFGIATQGWLGLVGTEGSLQLNPAYEYTEGLELSVTIDEKTRHRAFAKRDQFAAELLYFSDCILEDREPEPNGWEGLADVRVINALHQSIQRGMPLRLPPSQFLRNLRHPDPSMRIDRPPVPREPKLVRAEGASE